MISKAEKIARRPEKVIVLYNIAPPCLDACFPSLPPDSDLKTAFTKKGSPGESLHMVYEELLGSLKLPPEIVGVPAAVDAGLTGDTCVSFRNMCTSCAL